MARAGDAVPPAKRRAGEDPVGPEPPDRPGDVAPQLDRRGDACRRGTRPGTSTSVTPRTAAAARCSASRIAGIRSRGVSSKPPASPRVTSRYATSMPAADPAGDGAGGAEVDVIGVREDAQHPPDVGQRLGGRRKPHASASDQLAPAGPQDQQGELSPVGAQGVAVAVQDLLLAGQDQPGAAGGDPGLADLAGDRGPLEPERDQGFVDLIEARPQVADVRVRARFWRAPCRPRPARPRRTGRPEWCRSSRAPRFCRVVGPASPEPGHENAPGSRSPGHFAGL